MDTVAFSIGIYGGTSPLRLSPLRDTKNPVLSWEDVHDANADFVADPFMILVDGTWHMFFEVLDIDLDRGIIGFATSTDQESWTYQGIVLQEPFHLSYPHVFAFGGEHYLLPEGADSNALRLYRATKFPRQWSPVATLLDGGRFVDPSIFQYDDRWWLFADTSCDERHDTLRLFFADDLLGRWQEHPGSPVIRNDARGARPAGRVVPWGDGIIRFAQDCSSAYGAAVRAFVISELTRTKYREQEITSGYVLEGSGQGWNAEGMHHVDAHMGHNGQWRACVDGWTTVPTKNYRKLLGRLHVGTLERLRIAAEGAGESERVQVLSAELTRRARGG